ncbi:B3 domain-containing protein Os11g0197600-like [Actinidia eriantha]|uniref:B3 domain-containing protein Os11g0197600-like n=1 Tax=Actinidia eriantha TaxID=165200 RepID=UPI002585BD46|nr:B3 domain-containing protein Os11g0197600-like [Actinidia eriantha]
MEAIQPQFFKVFLPEINSNWLHIPLGFVKYMKGNTTGSVFLTGPSGNTWQVDLIKTGDGLFFRGGWVTFVKDHLAEFGDFFVFKNTSDFHFKVTIFDKSACEKQSAFHAKCSQDMGNFVNSKGKKRLKVQTDVSSGTFQGAPQTRRMNTRSMAAFAKTDPGSYDLLMQTQTHEKRESWVLFSHCRSFVKRMTRYNVRQVFVMRIPAPFMKDNFLDCQSRNIVLRIPEGNEWIVKLVRQGGCGCLSGGWNNFVRDNHIEEGDTCTFELVGDFEMLVHISRKIEEFLQAVGSDA